MTDLNGVLEQSTAVVTGGARGLGRAMAEALLAAGASVLIVDIDDEPIDEALAALAGRVAGHRADISDRGQVDGVVRRCVEEFGTIDVVINNAGIGMSAIRAGDRYTNPVRFWEVDESWVRRFFEVHVLGSFLLSTAALPHLCARPHGRIVTVTTSLTTMLAVANAPYGPMKAASEAFCSAMAQDLAGTTVTANVLVPGGAADTRMVPDAPSRPRANLVAPALMGPPAVFLASAASDGISARRIVARDWDPARTDAENLERCATGIGWTGR